MIEWVQNRKGGFMTSFKRIAAVAAIFFGLAGEAHGYANLHLTAGVDYFTGFDQLNSELASVSQAWRVNPTNAGADITPIGPLRMGFEVRADLAFDLGPKVFWTHLLSAWTCMAFTTGTIESAGFLTTYTTSVTAGLWTVGLDATTVIPINQVFSFRWGVGIVGGTFSVDSSERSDFLGFKGDVSGTGHSETLVVGYSFLVSVRVELDSGRTSALELTFRYLNLSDKEGFRLVSPVIQCQYVLPFELAKL
jgi:hypothetical protein